MDASFQIFSEQYHHENFASIRRLRSYGNGNTMIPMIEKHKEPLNNDRIPIAPCQLKCTGNSSGNSDFMLALVH